MTFGERLKELLEDNDISQRQLANELNIAYSTLNGYINDYRQPDYQQLISISRYFSVSTDYLLGAVNQPATSSASVDENTQRMLYYYQRLNPDMQTLALQTVKNMYDFNNLRLSK